MKADAVDTAETPNPSSDQLRRQLFEVELLVHTIRRGSRGMLGLALALDRTDNDPSADGFYFMAEALDELTGELTERWLSMLELAIKGDPKGPVSAGGASLGTED